MTGENVIRNETSPNSNADKKVKGIARDADGRVRIEGSASQVEKSEVEIFAFIAAKPAAVMRNVEAAGTSIQPFAIILLIITAAGWNCLLCSSPPRS